MPLLFSSTLCVICTFFWCAVSFSFTSFDALNPEDYAIVQYDSRALSDYWLTSASWNQQYAIRHGHKFIFYQSDTCVHESGLELATPWCKVWSMVSAVKDFPDAKVFVYLDSDAVIDRDYEDMSLSSYMEFMQRKLSWDVAVKPMIFNQDGPCWWCDLIKKKGYSTCLNSGTVAWVRSPHSTAVLEQWWASVADPYESNPLKRKFRTAWPWEQDRQMAVYHRSPEHIQIASYPGRAYIPQGAGKKDWCFSHLPNFKCFISHYCANKQSKQVMSAVYRLNSTHGDGSIHGIHTYKLHLPKL